MYELAAEVNGYKIMEYKGENVISAYMPFSIEITATKKYAFRTLKQAIKFAEKH